MCSRQRLVLGYCAQRFSGIRRWQVSAYSSLRCSASMKPTVIATIVCLIAAVSEALVTGSDPRSRFRRLRLPRYSPAFRIWILIGLFYYVMCFVILQHLLSAADFFGLHRLALVVVIAMLGCNAACNALFFPCGALRLSFLAFLRLVMFVVSLYVV